MLNTIQVVLVQGSCWEVLYNKQYITQQLLSKQHLYPTSEKRPLDQGLALALKCSHSGAQLLYSEE